MAAMGSSRFPVVLALAATVAVVTAGAQSAGASPTAGVRVAYPPESSLVLDLGDVVAVYPGDWRRGITFGPRHYSSHGFRAGWWSSFLRDVPASSGLVFSVISSVDRYAIDKYGRSPGAIWEVRHAEQIWLSTAATATIHRVHGCGDEAYLATFADPQNRFGGQVSGTAVFFRKGPYAVAVLADSGQGSPAAGPVGFLAGVIAGQLPHPKKCHVG
jgi:hypothetical protein